MHNDKYLTIRIDRVEREALAALARDDDRSLASYCRRILVEHVKSQGVFASAHNAEERS